MNRYILFCTPEQTKKALELGAPIEQVFYNVVTKEALKRYNLVFIAGKEYKIPTAEQIIGWLEEQLNVREIFIRRCGNWRYEIYIDPHYHLEENGFASRKEATLAAIDAALEYLTNNKK